MVRYIAELGYTPFGEKIRPPEVLDAARQRQCIGGEASGVKRDKGSLRIDSYGTNIFGIG